MFSLHNYSTPTITIVSMIIIMNIIIIIIKAVMKKESVSYVQ